MARVILTFNVEAEKQELIKELALKLQTEYIPVQKEDYEQKLGHLAKIKGFPRERKFYRGVEFPMEMMLLSGFDSAALDLFLNQYKKAGIEPIKLKAVLTKHNVFWTPIEVYHKLEKEAKL